MNWETWGPPLVVLGVGLVVGLVAGLRLLKQSGTETAPTDATLEDLVARREQLVDHLRIHEGDRGKMPAAEWQARFDALLDQAARALRDEDTRRASIAAGTATSPAPDAGTAGGNPWRSLAWGAGVAGFMVVLALVLTESTRPRASGDTMTGGDTTGSQAGEMDPAIAAFRNRIATERAAAKVLLLTDPQDLDALNTLGHWAVFEGDLGAAMEHIEAARGVNPDDPHVLTHLAVLQLQVGMDDKAEAGLDQALAADPALVEAMIWKGIVRQRMGDMTGARTWLQDAGAQASTPDERAMALGTLSRLEQLAAQTAAPSAAPTAASTPQAPAADAAVRLQGQVRLPDGVAADGVAADGLVYIAVRRGQAAGGPPVAAKKIPAASLPTTFTITDADMPFQAPWPDQVWIVARVDGDGNAMTREAGLPQSAVLGPIAAGTETLDLVLDQVVGD